MKLKSVFKNYSWVFAVVAAGLVAHFAVLGPSSSNDEQINRTGQNDEAYVMIDTVPVEKTDPLDQIAAVAAKFNTVNNPEKSSAKSAPSPASPNNSKSSQPVSPSSIPPIDLQQARPSKNLQGSPGNDRKKSNKSQKPKKKQVVCTVSQLTCGPLSSKI